MPRPVVPLTDRSIYNAKAKHKPRRLFDGGGLHVLINPDGSKYWRLKYLFNGKEKRIGLGIYPQIGLAKAREKAIEARRILDSGVDPAAQRKSDKETNKKVEEVERNTFKLVAMEWYERKRGEWAVATARKAFEALTIDLIPAIGERPIAQLSTPEIVIALQEIEKRSPHMAHKARQYCGAIARYAISTGRREDGREFSLRSILKTLDDSHFPTFDEKELPGFLKKLEGYSGNEQTRIAIKLLMLTFVRPSELANAKWEEFDLNVHEWRIPAERMKMKHPHIVPLSKQAINLLHKLHTLTAYSPFLFASERAPLKQSMARDTLSKVLRTMGYQGKATPHGFRAMASTMLNEMGFHPDWIERQLAHKERNKIRAVYNRAQYLSERKRMMQHWADYLDAIASGKVIKGKFRKIA